MITNLFSIFDPSTSILSIAWLTVLIPIIFLVNIIWNNVSTVTLLQKIIIDNFNGEVSYSLGNTENGTEIVIILIFMVILSANLVALYPQNFSITAHLPITVPLSLSIWLAIVTFGWIKNTNHILIHLLPQGTPVPLMNFIVIIEITSNIIRPLTLCVRLTANLIAGHLLMSLLGSALIQIQIHLIILSALAPLILTILEWAVACIQAYVFMTLITLYATEIN